MANPFMQRAIELAVENVRLARGGPFGAVIVKGSEVVAEGYNLVTGTCDPTAHAEVTAIRRAAAATKNFNLEGCEIYTSCEPCPMCLGAIYWARLDRIYFGSTHQDAAEAGFDDSLIYQEMRRSLEERKIPIIGMDRDDAMAAFAAWRNAPAKVDY
ncbi:MAG TPA: nucleoside deaminase [Bryobacteraceae bacterium]|jgi:tRNA(Arg) A34 adenosine deaminase TadA